ncbi:chaplin family protein [Nonomuraea typhae]|uniref:chaplin family protein n=1 Tax=Nonomuraea typhae TaxID=2603600 RepID=UPI0012FC58E7|nr:chaplin family protein [Nonomuraea typhae]
MLKKTLAAAGVLAMLSMAAPAHADLNTSGNNSVLGGNQVFAPIDIPIVICGNAVAVIGVAVAGCKGTAHT